MATCNGPGLQLGSMSPRSNARAHLVGNLDAHERGAGNLRDAHGRRGERKGYVVSEVGELGEADAAGELDLNIVTVGPASQPTTLAGRLNSSSVCCRMLAVWRSPRSCWSASPGDAEHARIGQGEALECRGRGTVGG